MIPFVKTSSDLLICFNPLIDPLICRCQNTLKTDNDARVMAMDPFTRPTQKDSPNKPDRARPILTKWDAAISFQEFLLVKCIIHQCTDNQPMEVFFNKRKYFMYGNNTLALAH